MIDLWIGIEIGIALPVPRVPPLLVVQSLTLVVFEIFFWAVMRELTYLPPTGTYLTVEFKISTELGSTSCRGFSRYRDV